MKKARTIPLLVGALIILALVVTLLLFRINGRDDRGLTPASDAPVSVAYLKSDEYITASNELATWFHKALSEAKPQEISDNIPSLSDDTLFSSLGVGGMCGYIRGVAAYQDSALQVVRKTGRYKGFQNKEWSACVLLGFSCFV